ncbi:MAG TPA: M13 family metallopeptidase [Candidatus Angelobacter sp.]|nr:M13 family metallopeptidase [Candidatus Angelobacter sp.]
MNKTVCLCATMYLILLSAADAQSSRPAQQPGHKDPNAATPEETLPYSPSLDLTSMDRSVDPCANFYQYSCGGWQKKNPIPPDQVSWSVYGKLYQDNLNFLRGILEQAAAEKGERDAVTQKIGDFYAACMDEAAVEKRAVAAIKPELDAIAQLKAVNEMAQVVARLHLRLTRPILFSGDSRQDPDDSEQQIAVLDQGGLGLPDRDYYTKEDAKSKEIRERYVQHVQKTFELLGDPPETAKINADAVMRMETALANASMTRVERRDPYKRKNKIKLEELSHLAPDFNWQAYFRELKAPPFAIINVAPSSFFKAVNAQLTSEPLDHWKNYLRFHVASAYAPYLSSKFVAEDFDFNTRYLRGAKEMQPRWKRCVQFTDRDLGEALGQVYVRKVFPPELKQSTLEMARRIESAMEQRIGQLDWMSQETKQQALAKLHAIRNKIGYPDKWRDYSSVKIEPGDFVGNVRRANEFERRRRINKIGQQVDRTEWGMTPPTVNAYYSGQMNDINFPAGVLQPPLYDAKLDDAPNYGNTGGTVGHELTHGFDDQGSKFDAQGNLREWWTKDDRQKFEERTQCVSDQYAQYVVVDDIHINSKLTLGEDVADLGGEILAYIAWKDATRNKDLHTVDGLTPDQRFFVGFAQWACDNERPEDMRVRALTDPHSPARYRINGVVVNMPEFTQAFSCKPGQSMAKAADKVCKVW